MEGDKRIDELMRPVHAAINRHVKNSDAKTDIYNRAYEALMNNMDALDVSAAVTAKQIAENAKNLQRAEKAEAEIAALRTENEFLKAQTRWIPVSERLPMDIDEQYLTLSPNSEVFIMFWNEYWYSPFDENGDESCINVTHWMQLPIPPRDGE